MSLGYWETFIESQGDGPVLTAAAAATCLPAQAKRILESGTLRYIGQQMRVYASGRISCAVTTPGTARFDVRLGGTVVFDTLAMNLNIVAKTSVHWVLDVLLTVRSVGSAGNLMGQGTWTSEAVIGSAVPTVGSSGVFTVPYATAPAVGGNIDMNAANVFDMFFTQTAVTGSMTLHQLNVSLLN